MSFGHIDCHVCLHATLFFPNLLTYTPNIVWNRFNQSDRWDMHPNHVVSHNHTIVIIAYIGAA